MQSCRWQLELYPWICTQGPKIKHRQSADPGMGGYLIPRLCMYHTDEKTTHAHTHTHIYIYIYKYMPAIILLYM